MWRGKAVEWRCLGYSTTYSGNTYSGFIIPPLKPSPLLMRGRGLQFFSNITMFIYPHLLRGTGWTHIFLRGVYWPCLIILNVVQRVYNLFALRVSLYYNRQVYILNPSSIECKRHTRTVRPESRMIAFRRGISSVCLLQLL